MKAVMTTQAERILEKYPVGSKVSFLSKEGSYQIGTVVSLVDKPWFSFYMLNIRKEDGQTEEVRIGKLTPVV